MKRLSVSRLGSTDSSEQSGVMFKHISTRGTQRGLALLVFRHMRGIELHERWSVRLSYVVVPPPATATSRGNTSSAPGVGSVFGKV